jgi:peptidoglycan/LPS O-acetylase OafA/YrhL
MTRLSNSPPILFYRAEIDGLRAIAVISVILYHAKIVLFGKLWFQGGFIGVDIFFVISGYLITRIILSELYEKGSFSFLNFYERRARRILPMLFLVIFVSAPFAWQMLLPSDFLEYVKSILASLYFGSNFFFYFSTTEYGTDNALLKPFLHTWSLGVEEQFYLVFPIFALFTFKYYKNHLLTMLITLSLISLFFSELMAVRNPDLNFYLPFSRFWELGVGSILAFRELTHKGKQNNFLVKSLPVTGLCLIIYSISSFNGNTPHPSLHTTLPILGVALIIGFASKNEVIGKVLGCKIFVWLGLISYSAYLWHFPIFAFSRLGSSTHNNIDKLEWIFLTLVLSILSYFAVEKPFRGRLKTRSFNTIIGISLIILVTSAIYAIKTEGLRSVARLGFNADITDTIQPNYLFDDKGCGENETYIHNDTTFCTMGVRKKDTIDYILVGDSHAMHSQQTIEQLSIELGLKGLFGGNSGCPALLGVYPVRGLPHPNDWSKKCFGFNQNAYDLAKNLNIKTIFLISRWDYYVNGSDSKALNNTTDVGLEIGNTENARRVYDEAVDRTVSRYSEQGIRVVVMLQIPHQNTNIKRILEELMTIPSIADKQWFINKSKELFISLSDHKKHQVLANTSWLKRSEEIKNGSLVLIDPTDEFCEGAVCPIYDENASFYTDFDHASSYGFDRLANKFKDVMSK